jgi:hypothetical protein
MFFNVQGGCFLRACFRAQNDSIERGFLTCSSGSCENVSNMSLSNDIDVEGRLPTVEKRDMVHVANTGISTPGKSLQQSEQL